MRKPTNSEVIAAWDTAADHLTSWSDEGDFSHKHLLNPALFTLLGDTRGLQILDAGCGEGYLARLLARQGALVTGIEPATRLFNLCIQHEREEQLGITYLQQDICDLSVPDGLFDRIVLNMTLMDVPDLERAIASSVRALSPGGRLVASILHPCLDEQPMSFWSQQRHAEITEYFDELVHPQTFAPFFHRPLSMYLNVFIESGLIIKRVIEPRLTNSDAAAINGRDAHVPTFIVFLADKS